MKVIYHCVGGTHSSALAAAVHLNKLPKDRIPNENELMDLGYFDTLEKQDRGKIIYRGTDEFGNEIYTLGRQFNTQLVLNSVTTAYKIGHGNVNDVLLIDTMPTVNNLMRIGGFSSRRMHLVGFGRPIVIKGSQKAYNDIKELVGDTKRKLN